MGATEAWREHRPQTPELLWEWIRFYLGVRLALRGVCEGHQTPFEALCCWQFQNPSIALQLGPRGGGKSFISGLDTHIRSRFMPRYRTQILGGSKAQSQQIYDVLNFVRAEGGDHADDRDAITMLRAERATYRNGSEVELLTASSKSVRGPHVPSLKLDEIDEIDSEIFQSAWGMVMENRQKGHTASTIMTSTWHDPGGVMSEMIEKAKESNGQIPYHQFCIYDVLERCPEERSGPNLEHCGTCPLKTSCHSDLDGYGKGQPKAKRANGHYSIDSLIQKVRAVSIGTFESDYLCQGPKAEGRWFSRFRRQTHVSALADHNPNLPVYLSVDSGVYTGAVWFQVSNVGSGYSHLQEVTVFADYLGYDLSAAANANAIIEITRQRCGGVYHNGWTDPAGGHRNATGAALLSLYIAAGLKLEPWPLRPVGDGLTLLDSFIEAADGSVHLKIHPRCEDFIKAMEQYKRAKVAGKWRDYPQDPQHPHEDMVDPLRSGLVAVFPEGRTKPFQPYSRQPASRVF